MCVLCLLVACHITYHVYFCVSWFPSSGLTPTCTYSTYVFVSELGVSSEEISRGNLRSSSHFHIQST